MSNAYVWAENGAQYYSTTGLGQGGVSNAAALDYAIDSVLASGDEVVVGGDTVLGYVSFGLRCNLAGAIKNIKRADDSVYGTGNVTLQGISSTYMLYSAQVLDGMTIEGPFIVDGSVGAWPFLYMYGVALQNSTFKQLTFKDFTSYAFRAANGLSGNVWEDCVFMPRLAGAGSRIITDSATDTGNTLRRCKLYYSDDAVEVLNLTGIWTIENPEFYGHVDEMAIKLTTASGTHTITNPKYLDWYDTNGNYVRCGSLFVSKESGDLLTVNEQHGAHINPNGYAWESSGASAVINAVNSYSIGGYAKENSSSTNNLDNCLVIDDQSPVDSDGTLTNCQTQTSNDGNLSAKLTNYAAPYGAIICNFDDLEDNLRDIDSQPDLVEVCINKGAKPILFIQPGSSLYQYIEQGIEFDDDPEKLAQFNRIVNWVAQGKVEVGIHGMTHMPLDTVGICNIKKAASIDSHTVTCTITSSSFDLSCPTLPAADISLTLDLTHTKSMGDIYDVLEASEYYTVSEKYWYVSETVQGSGRKLVSRLLAETSFTVPDSDGTAVDIEFDKDAWYRWEISTCRAWLLAHFPSLQNADIKYMATPHGQTPDAFIQFLTDNESDPDIQVRLNRGNKPASEPDFNGDMNDIRQINTRLLNTVGWDSWAGGWVSAWDAGTITYESVYARGQAIAEYTKTRGAIFMPYSHDKELEANVEMWTAFLDGIRSVDPGLLKSMSEVDAYIRTNGVQDETNHEVWHVDWSAEYGDWDLQPKGGSALLDNGKPITGIHDQAELATDLGGKPIYFNPPIGPYSDGVTNKTVTEDDYTPTGWSVRKGAKVRITGGGDIDMSGISETESLVQVELAGYISSFAGKAGVTGYKWEGGGGSSALAIGGVLG